MASPSLYEPHLVPTALDLRFLPDLPERLIGDRGYDSVALVAQLWNDYDIEMTARHRRGRRVRTQDGLAARRTKRR